jgi:hypothetical protein
MNKLHRVAFGALLFTASAFGQNKSPDIIVKDITFTLSPAPAYNILSPPNGKSTPKQDTSLKWLVVEAELESSLDWADEVQVKYYVVAQYAATAYVDGNSVSKLPNDQQFDILTTTVNVVNVQKSAGTGRKSIIPVFLDPNTVRKYGEGTLSKFIPEVAVEVMYKGIVQNIKWTGDGEKKYGRFWETKKQPKSGVLLNLLQSPWWPAYSDYYERVKPLSTPSLQ